MQATNESLIKTDIEADAGIVASYKCGGLTTDSKIIASDVMILLSSAESHLNAKDDIKDEKMFPSL